MEHDDRLRPQAHRVEELGVQLEVAHGRVADALLLGVEHDVLAGVRGQAHAELARPRPGLREPLAALLDLTVELGQVGMGAVRARARTTIR